MSIDEYSAKSDDVICKAIASQIGGRFSFEEFQ